MQYRLKKFILYQQWRNVDPDPLPVTSICSGREFIMFPDLPTRYSLRSGSYLQLHLSDGRTHTAGQPSSMKEDQFWHLSKMSRNWLARNCAAKHKVVLVYPVVEVNLAHCPCWNSLVYLEVDAATAKNSEDLDNFARFAFACSIPSVATRSRNIDWLYNLYSYTQ